MGYLSKLRRTERVELVSGYWAEVRALLADDDDDARDATLGGKEAIKEAVAAGSLGQQWDARRYNRELLARCVTAWNLDDDDGAVLPVTVETVGYLSDADRDLLVAAIQARAKLDPKDAKNTASASA